MATYAQLQAGAERKAKRAAQDQTMAARHAAFDAEVKDRTDKRGFYKTMKYERPSFAVVTASDAFRDGWDRIFGSKKEDDTNGPLASDSPASPDPSRS